MQKPLFNLGHIIDQAMHEDVLFGCYLHCKNEWGKTINPKLVT